MKRTRPERPTQPAAPTPYETHRFHMLDALRGVAAIIVVFVHSPSYLKIHLPNGFLAVDLFFCLSGFVIAFSYGERIREGLSVRRFLLIRLVRLYPLYLLGTVLGILRVAASHSRIEFFHQYPIRFGSLTLIALFALPNVFNSLAPFDLLYPFDMPAWSLFFELLANLGHGVLIRLRATSLFLPLLTTAGFAGLVWHVTRGMNLDGGRTSTTLSSGFARVAYSYCVGIYIYKAFTLVSKKIEGTLSMLCGITLIVALTLMLCAPRVRMEELYQLAFITLCPALFVFSAAVLRTPKLFSRLCSFLGALSFPLYILHFPLSLGQENHALSNLMLSHSLIAWEIILLAVTVVTAFSFVAGQYFDASVRKFLTRQLARSRI